MDGRRPPRRIVSVCASNTELLALLGAEELLVGRDRYSDWPTAIREVPVVGGDLDVDVEAVGALEPELVLASRSVPGMERVVARLEAAGLPVVVYDPVSWEGILADLIDLGKRLGRTARAEALVAAARACTRAWRRRFSAHTPRRVVVEWWPKPTIVPFRDSWVGDLLAWVGARNPFGSQEGRSGVVAPELAAAADPELVVVAWCGVAEAKLRPELARTRWEALLGRSVRVEALSEAYLGRPALRLLEGARHLARWLWAVELELPPILAEALGRP